MEDLFESLLDPLWWLVHPLFFPLGAIVVSVVAAVGMERTAVRVRRMPVRPPLLVQPWAWISTAVLALMVFLVVALAVVAPEEVLITAAWLSLPCAVIVVSLREARPPRR